MNAQRRDDSVVGFWNALDRYQVRRRGTRRGRFAAWLVGCTPKAQRNVQAKACRYCGILPGQDLPRPSYPELRAENDRLRAALELIDRWGCLTFHGGRRCSDAGSGRIRGGEYGAESWCDACIARAALGAVPYEEEG